MPFSFQRPSCLISRTILSTSCLLLSALLGVRALREGTYLACPCLVESRLQEADER
jgi:hypothetical protein